MATRKSGELQEECKTNGIPLAPGKKYSREDMEVLLRDFYWARDHKGEVMPEQYEVMLAEKIADIEEKDAERGTDHAEAIWTGRQWVAQLKLDGCRLVMECFSKGHLFPSRNKSVKDFLYSDKSENLPYHTKLDMGDNEGTVLDGEMLAPYSSIDTRKFGDKKGTVTAKALQACAAVLNCGPGMAAAIQKHYGPLEYHVFDILKYKGKDVRTLSYATRLEMLAKAFSTIPEETQKLIKLVSTVTENRRKFYEDMVKAGHEGIMLKDLMAPYEGKRTKTILKAKRFDDVDAVCVGFIPGDEKKAWKDMVGGLIFAVTDKRTKEWHVVGCVGSMTLEFRKSITKPCAPYQVATNDEEIIWTADENGVPGSFVPVKGGPRTISYELDRSCIGKVAVIRFQEYTKNLRGVHCRIPDAYTKEGAWYPWREDKPASQCIMDIDAIREKVLKGERL